ncbi:Pyruvate, phosphate dikinase [Candidatus Bealeia paramacronuclearis]|uniref:Pyruvate, phosphate dikinase n=1 Tax=Candidatus Bealeia paramacronuclearis TaxID=1921001 RepID=A0ABZ2C2J3_9PROT|nr:Pyruvate, phosphate dikinase [Candidatus Bealeia paramacronuclearis]
MTKWVYGFSEELPSTITDKRGFLGGKGAGLCEMTQLGLPVPPGFVISTEVCSYFYKNKKFYPSDLKAQADTALKDIEKQVEAEFGNPKNPLLVSVRSGARASMPGMMDTVLNLGLNDETVKGLAELSADARFAYDSYRRFIQMYGDVVLEIDIHHFETILAEYKRVLHVKDDGELKPENLQHIIEAYQEKVLALTGKPFPQDVHDQLWGAISAVFGSWNNQRAVTYRRLNNIPEDWGTAVIVQAMVFGNQGNTSGTGVGFTRNPSTGVKEFFGEYLINAQGEDVVAGIRTPAHIIADYDPVLAERSMERVMPKVFKELMTLQDRLEKNYCDMQDIEFTIQKGKLWLLQTRNGKRTAEASLKIAVDMVQERLIDKAEAIRRFDPETLEQLLHPGIAPNAELPLFGKGLPASPGAAVGRVYFTSEDCEQMAKDGVPVILVRPQTSPEDIHGMHAAQGILTTCGGMTSHAAVVARGMGRPCIVGAQDINIDVEDKVMTSGGVKIKEGDFITLNGAKGEVFIGEAELAEAKLSHDFETLMGWADELRHLKVRANADTPHDALQARKLGAEGIGLCRTEHMFFDADRILWVREMILAKDLEARKKALDKLLPIQRDDFAAIFEAMEGLPVTVRLLDPPLHEFLPRSDVEIAQLAKSLHMSESYIKQRVSELHEENPMLGHRGCRLGVTYPEIYEMQVRALFEGAALAQKTTGKSVQLEIMIPLIALAGEFKYLKALVLRVAEEAERDLGQNFTYLIGTMIELPRAALKAGKIALDAQFFSFGTNDLTQMTMGISRDDSGSFVPQYRALGILDRDPFSSLDQTGVGELVKFACQEGRKTNPALKLGVCGEHGGDPLSINFFEKTGLDYVSCSPYRVPIARLAAAKAAIGFGRITEGLSEKVA